MSVAKDKAIAKIMSDFEKASMLTLNQLELLKQVVNTKETGIPAEIIQQLKKNEKKLDNLDLKINDRVINVIVLYNPVASELRKIMACYRMITNVERIGDLIIKAMSHTRKMKDTRLLLLNLDDINSMLDQTTVMLKKALFAFLEDNEEDALWVISNDVVVDKLNHHISRNSILAEEVFAEVNKVIEDYSSIKSLVSAIERMADHAAHIGEAVIFALKGKDVRHKES